MKGFFALLLISFIGITAYSQDNNQGEMYKVALMRTKTGAEIIYNGTKHSFIIDIKGDTIKPTENPNYIVVDGKVVQYFSFPLENNSDFENMDMISQKKNLLDYMNSEVEYDKGLLNSNDINEQYEFMTLNGKIFLFWTFDMPDSTKNAFRQCLLITICFDQMLVLNIPVIKEEERNVLETYDKIKEYLISTGQTLKCYDFTLDLNKLSNEQKK